MSEEWWQETKQSESSKPTKEEECKTFKDKITIANAAILDTFQNNNMRERILTNNTRLAVIYFLAQFKEFFLFIK